MTSAQPERETTGRTGIFRSLRYRNYRLYATGAILSNVGTWMQRIAQDWLVLGLTDGNAFALGVVTFLQFVPTFGLGLVGGVIADRYDKQNVLRFTQAGVAVTALVLGILDLTNVVHVWHIYGLALVLGIINAIESPSRVSIASELVPEKDVVNAVGLNSSSFNAARLIGPAVAGVLIGIIGTGPVFLLNAASSVWIIVLLSMIDPTKTYGVDRQRRERGQIREGIRYVRARPEIVLTILLVTCVSFFGLNLQVIVPLVSTQVFHQGAVEYGLLASSLALGTLGGALFGAGRKSRPRLRSLVVSATLFGIAEIAIAWVGIYWLFALCLVPVGLVSMYFIISANAFVQLSVESSTRGRVMALYMMFFMGAGAFGSPLVGGLTSLMNIQWALAICGAATAVSALGIGWLLARRLGGFHVEAHLRTRPWLQVHLGEEQMFPYRREPSEQVT